MSVSNPLEHLQCKPSKRRKAAQTLCPGDFAELNLTSFCRGHGEIEMPRLDDFRRKAHSIDRDLVQLAVGLFRQAQVQHAVVIARFDLSRVNIIGH
jgi:hypothetical protein